jgi:hypothetical protein
MILKQLSILCKQVVTLETFSNILHTHIKTICHEYNDETLSEFQQFYNSYTSIKYLYTVPLCQPNILFFQLILNEYEQFELTSSNFLPLCIRLWRDFSTLKIHDATFLYNLMLIYTRLLHTYMTEMKSINPIDLSYFDIFLSMLKHCSIGHIIFPCIPTHQITQLQIFQTYRLQLSNQQIKST